MFIDKEYFDSWMQRFMKMLDEIVEKLDENTKEQLPKVEGDDYWTIMIYAECSISANGHFNVTVRQGNCPFR